jgi:hypothetical protein
MPAVQNGRAIHRPPVLTTGPEGTVPTRRGGSFDPRQNVLRPKPNQRKVPAQWDAESSLRTALSPLDSEANGAVDPERMSDLPEAES